MMDAKFPSVYRIRDSATGLWSAGGTRARFTKRGKVWTSRAGLLAHLVQYLEKNYNFHRDDRNRNLPSHTYVNAIGETWVVLEATGTEVKEFTAREFVKLSPGWKKWLEASQKPWPSKRCDVPCPSCSGTGRLSA